MQETAVLSLLANDTSVQALADDRVYIQAPEQQPAFPFVFISRDETEALYSLDGRIHGCDRIAILVDVYGTAYTPTKQLLNAIKSVLHGYAGTVAGIVVAGLFHNEDFDVQDPDHPTVYHLQAHFNLFA